MFDVPHLLCVYGTVVSVCKRVLQVNVLADESVAPSARSTTRLVVGVVIAGFCAFLGLYSTQPLLSLLREVFGASEAAVSLTISAATLAVAVASPFVGLLADAVGRKRIMVPCLFVIAIATCMGATAHSLHELIVWRFIAGLATPGVIAVLMAYISEEAVPGTTGRVMAAYVTGSVIGGLTGRVTSGMAADYLNWRWSFIVTGGMTLLGAIVTTWLLPRSTHFRRCPDPLAPLRAMKGHIRNPQLLATYFAGFNALFCHVGLFTYVNFYLANPPFSLSTAALGSVFLVYALGVVVTPLSGRMIDRLGHRAGAMIAAGTIAGGVLITAIPHVALIVLGLAVASTGVFIAQAAAASHVGHVAKGSRSAATGLYVAVYYLGGSVGATALSYPWKHGGWLAIVASLLVAQAISGTLAWRFFSRGHHEAQLPDPAALGA